MTHTNNNMMSRKIWSILLIFLYGSPLEAQANWAGDIACIIYENCASCHRDNGIAPFSLLSYNDAFAVGGLLADVVRSGEMPPWPPSAHYRELADARLLTQAEKDLIIEWVNNGLPAGNLDEAPAPPVFDSKEWITQPDLVVQVPEYTSNARDYDEYRCFVIPSGLTQNKFISGFEVVPGNPGIVHHVLVFHDNTNRAAELDVQDPDPGYVCFGGIGVDNPQLLGGWAPGQQATFLPEGMGVMLPANANFVVQLHYPEGSEGKSDQTKINFKFSDVPNPRQVRIDPFLNHITSLINGPLNIPANTVKSYQENWTVPFDMTILGAAPHMHLIGTSIKSYAIPPSGDTLQLIDIPGWDFEWQGFYQFRNAAILKQGTQLYADAIYDNTSSNPLNPNAPPRLVEQGEATTDEMMVVFFPWLVYQPGDENLVFEDRPIPGSDDCKALTSYEDTFNASHGLKLFPNPVRNRVLTLERPRQYQQSLTMRVFDLHGRLVFEQIIEASGTPIQIPVELSRGVYPATISSPGGELLYREKIVVLQ